ncbi:MAG: diguanylate cyclase [Planctomycetaceae bacterium]
MNNENHKVPVRLVRSKEQSNILPPTVHQYRSLESAGISLEDNRYVLATDDDGRIVGVVSRERILQRLRASNDQERGRWAEMPVGALMNVVFTDTPTAATKLEDDLECVAITEGGGLIGLAVENDVFLSWERLEPMLTVAISDPLTGLMNRLAYERRLNEEWYRAIRTGTSVGVLVADLDGLKPINDIHGHQAGDAVLKRTASLLEESLRSYDILARYGGDEFVALCVGCRPGEIGIPIQRIQEKLLSADFSFDGNQFDVALSIGAAVRHDEFSSATPVELFRAADECMYLAKGSDEYAYICEFGEDYDSNPKPLRRLAKTAGLAE